MGYAQVYISGDRLVECNICGLDYRFSRMRKGVMGSQKGLEVCPYCFDGIHPNEERVTFRPEEKLEEIK
jgi:hypothetical protein